MPARFVFIVFSAASKRPVSSRRAASMSEVRSPRATASAMFTAWPRGRTIDRASAKPTNPVVNRLNTLTATITLRVVSASARISAAATAILVFWNSPKVVNFASSLSWAGRMVSNR